MFLLDYEKVNYSDPWALPYAERIKRLSLRERKVAYFYELADTSTFRYRVYNMAQTIQSLSKDTSASYFFLEDLNHTAEILAVADVIVICRVRYSSRINHLITSARAKNIKVLFDVDDFVFNTSYVHLILNTLDQDISHPHAAWDFWFAAIGRIGETLRLCDGAIATNSFLATQIKRWTGKPTNVIPNYLNREQIELSEKLFQQKVTSSFKRDERFCLGYFSGTPTHNKDFAVIASAVTQVLKARPDVTLRIVGFMDLKGELSHYRSQIEFLPLQDFLNLQFLIATTELNLVPLQDNLFTNCKSELKFFEAAICGTLSLASPIFTYKNAICDGDNGYLSCAYEWAEKIEHIIDNFDDYQPVAAKAYQDALDCFAWYNQLEKIEAALF